jgi:hypothetical protein
MTHRQATTTATASLALLILSVYVLWKGAVG